MDGRHKAGHDDWAVLIVGESDHSRALVLRRTGKANFVAKSICPVGAIPEFKKPARIGGPPVAVETDCAILELEGSGRKLFGGSDPVKKRGPWAVADLQVVTPPGDPD